MGLDINFRTALKGKPATTSVNGTNHAIETSSGSKVATSAWKPNGGWWLELPPPEKTSGWGSWQSGENEKLVVTCSALDEQPFISFSEGGRETYGEYDDQNLSGIFCKVAGPHGTRRFAIPTPSAETNGY